MKDPNLSTVMGRFPKGGAEALRVATERALGLADMFAGIALNIQRDANLSASGKKSKITEALPDTYRHVVEAGKAVRSARAELANRKAALGQVRIDKSDASAAALRAEIRAHLSRLSPIERMALALAEPEATWPAIASAPGFLSGFDPEMIARVRDQVIRTSGADEVRAIDFLQEGVEAAEAGIDVALEHIGRASGLDLLENQKILIPIQTAAA